VDSSFIEACSCVLKSVIHKEQSSVILNKPASAGFTYSRSRSWSNSLNSSAIEQAP
jgi:hypothetical protein